MKLSEKDKVLLELGKSNSQNTCDKAIDNENCILDGQLVVIGSLFGGTLFNLIVAFIAGSSKFMEWGIKHWCFTYIVALVLFGIGDLILNRLTKNS